MKELENVNLAGYTTVRIGGTAKRFLVPESTAELITLCKEEKTGYFIGGGSNLLISERIFDTVISLREFDCSIVSNGGGFYEVGASTRLQHFIKHINEEGYGGIEYLFSVPGLVGGAIVMNAGRGRKYNQAISDYIISVTVLENGDVKKYTKEECEFAYRTSRFKNSEIIVLSALFCFPEQSREDGERACWERLELCKVQQDNSGFNFGSVFSQADGRVLTLIRKIGLRAGQVQFSQKAFNWILNKGNGSFKDAKKLIVRVERIHSLFHLKIEREVILWE